MRVFKFVSLLILSFVGAYNPMMAQLKNGSFEINPQNKKFPEGLWEISLFQEYVVGDQLARCFQSTTDMGEVWRGAGGSPDLFNETIDCDDIQGFETPAKGTCTKPRPLAASVPVSNRLGPQSAHEGDGYIGLSFQRRVDYEGNVFQYREYVYQELCEPMGAEQTYRITYYVACANDGGSINQYDQGLFGDAEELAFCSIRNIDIALLADNPTDPTHFSYQYSPSKTRGGVVRYNNGFINPQVRSVETTEFKGPNDNYQTIRQGLNDDQWLKVTKDITVPEGTDYRYLMIGNFDEDLYDNTVPEGVVGTVPYEFLSQAEEDRNTDNIGDYETYQENGRPAIKAYYLIDDVTIERLSTVNCCEFDENTLEIKAIPYIGPLKGCAYEVTIKHDKCDGCPIQFAQLQSGDGATNYSTKMSFGSPVLKGQTRSIVLKITNVEVDDDNARIAFFAGTNTNPTCTAPVTLKCIDCGCEDLMNSENVSFNWQKRSSNLNLLEYTNATNCDLDEYHYTAEGCEYEFVAQNKHCMEPLKLCSFDVTRDLDEAVVTCFDEDLTVLPEVYMTPPNQPAYYLDQFISNGCALKLTRDCPTVLARYGMLYAGYGPNTLKTINLQIQTAGTPNDPSELCIVNQQDGEPIQIQKANCLECTYQTDPDGPSGPAGFQIQSLAYHVGCSAIPNVEFTPSDPGTAPPLLDYNHEQGMEALNYNGEDAQNLYENCCCCQYYNLAIERVESDVNDGTLPDRYKLAVVITKAPIRDAQGHIIGYRYPPKGCEALSLNVSYQAYDLSNYFLYPIMNKMLTLVQRDLTFADFDDCGHLKPYPLSVYEDGNWLAPTTGETHDDFLKVKNIYSYDREYPVRAFDNNPDPNEEDWVNVPSGWESSPFNGAAYPPEAEHYSHFVLKPVEYCYNTGMDEVTILVDIMGQDGLLPICRLTGTMDVGTTGGMRPCASFTAPPIAFRPTFEVTKSSGVPQESLSTRPATMSPSLNTGVEDVSDSQTYTVIVSDVLGKVVLRLELHNLNPGNDPTRDLQPGLYFVVVFDGASRITTRSVIVR